NARGDAIKVIEELSLKASKTSDLNALLAKLKITDGYVLIVCDHISDNLRLASRNLNFVSLCSAKYLNIARLLDTDTMVITKPALSELSSWLKPLAKAKQEAKS
ncbi:MAG: 50S ribosomal protein L4, partial [Candidatus Saccharimonadales bacterium]